MDDALVFARNINSLGMAIWMLLTGLSMWLASRTQLMDWLGDRYQAQDSAKGQFFILTCVGGYAAGITMFWLLVVAAAMHLLDLR